MQFSVVLNVKTFDEDALLFLAVNEEKVGTGAGPGQNAG